MTYRPISNPSVLSKLLERLVSKQLVAYLLENDLFPDLQSAYRSNHSTETAVLKVLSDILLAGITVTVRLVSCLWQRWPRHAVAKTTDVLLLTYYLNISVQAANLSDCRIESKLFGPNWNALIHRRMHRQQRKALYRPSDLAIQASMVCTRCGQLAETDLGLCFNCNYYSSSSVTPIANLSSLRARWAVCYAHPTRTQLKNWQLLFMTWGLRRSAKQ